MDAARAVFDEALQDEKNEPKPDGVRLEAHGGRSDYAVLYDLIFLRSHHQKQTSAVSDGFPVIEPESDRQ
jgi:hypothetical protein